MASFSSDVVEDELERILRTAGVDSCPIDPSSMQSLRQLVEERNRDDLPQHPAMLQRKIVTDSNKAASLKPAPPTNSSVASGVPPDAGSISNDDTASVILQQLKMQTDLIVGLQRQVEVLSDKVDRLEGTSEATSSNEKISVTSRIRYIPRSKTTRAHEITTPSPAAANRNEEDEAELQHQPLGPRPGRGTFGCAMEILRLFWIQSRDYVRPLDGALLFKLVFMVMVVTARISRNSSSNSNDNADGKIRMVTMLLMLGFLYHTRYLQYVYQFFWKENVPARVWNGDEDIAIPPPAAEDNHNNNGPQQQERQPPMEPNPVPPRLRQNDANEGNQGNWWRNGFLAGGIAPAAADPDNNNENAIVGLVKDIGYLVGSFIFSIFPMWNPEGQQRARQDEEPLLQGQLDGAIGDAEPEGFRENDNDQGIPEVRAPRNAMEAAGSDDEE